MGKNVNKKVLESLAKEGTLYCRKNRDYISLKQFREKRCYVSWGESNYCKYLVMIVNIEKQNGKS